MNKLQRMAIKINIPKPDESDPKNNNAIIRLDHTHCNYEIANEIRFNVLSNNLWVLQKAIKKHAKRVNSKDHQNVMAENLDRALEDKDTSYDAIRLLVKHGATLTHHLEKDSDYIYQTCATTSLENLKFLVDECEMLNEDHCSKVLFHACREDKKDIIEYLLKEKKTSAAHINERGARLDFESMSENLPTLVSWLQAAGLDFRAQAKPLLWAAMRAEDSSLIQRAWGHFSVQDKLGLTMEDIPQVDSKDNTLRLLVQHGIKPQNYAMFKARNAVEKRDLHSLQRILTEENLDINAQASRLLKLAFELRDPEMVNEIYAMGSSMQGRNSRDAWKFYRFALHSDFSSGYLNDLNKRDDAKKLFLHIISECVKEKTQPEYLDYTRKVLEMRDDWQQGELEDLFIEAVKANNKKIMPDLKAAGFALDKFCSPKIYDLVAACQSSFALNNLVEQGLDLKKDIGGLIARHKGDSDDRGFLSYFESIKLEQRIEEYPYWEKQDDNTIAELSFVRKDGDKGFLCLRRAFNFRAGVVDHGYETHREEKIDHFKPANTIPMSDFSRESLAKAQQALIDRDGHPQNLLECDKKPPQPIQKSVKPAKPV